MSVIQGSFGLHHQRVQVFVPDRASGNHASIAVSGDPFADHGLILKLVVQVAINDAHRGGHNSGDRNHVIRTKHAHLENFPLLSFIFFPYLLNRRHVIRGQPAILGKISGSSPAAASRF